MIRLTSHWLTGGNPWLRQHSAGARRTMILNGLKNLAWVMPLTVLIWIYAEREQQTTEKGVPVQVHVRINAANKLVKLIDPEEGMLMVDLFGPRVAIERVERELRVPGDAKSPIIIQVPPTLPAGRRTSLSVLTDVGNSPIFANEGVSVTAVSPPNIWVEVDDWKDFDLPVKAPPGLDTLMGEPVFSPATIKVRAPKSLFDQAEASHHMQLTADLSQREELNDPGHHEISNVPVTWIYHDQNVTISQPTVRASIDVKQRAETYLIKSVPIWTFTPPGFSDRYRIIFVNPSDPVIPNVTVSGPPDKIEQIRRDEGKDIKARLDVSNADVADGDHQKVLEFDIPDKEKGVTVVGDSASIKVSFRIVSRNSGE